MLPTDSKERKDTPIFSGVLMYFPDAIAEVAKVSKAGNDKHNGEGSKLEWTRDISNDHLDCVSRHLIDAGPDGDGMDGKLYHLANLVWRGLAQLQIVCECRKIAEVTEPGPVCNQEWGHSGPCNGYSRCNSFGISCYTPLAVPLPYPPFCTQIIPSIANKFRICKRGYGHPGDCELTV